MALWGSGVRIPSAPPSDQYWRILTLPFAALSIISPQGMELGRLQLFDAGDVKHGAMYVAVKTASRVTPNTHNQLMRKHHDLIG